MHGVFEAYNGAGMYKEQHLRTVFKFSNLSCAQRDLSASDIVPSSLPATICTYMYLLVATDFARDGQALPSELL